MMSIIEKIEKIKQQIEFSNQLAQELHKNVDFRFLENVSIPWERVEPSELGFIRVVSWLYVLYTDIKKNNKNIHFVFKQAKVTNYQNHIENINRLRTYFQHQITPIPITSTPIIPDRDTQTKQDCDNFFKDILQKNKDYPKSDNDWTEVLDKLLNDCLYVIQQINTSLEKLNSYPDKIKDITVKEWKKQLENTHEKYEFEIVFKATVADMGLQLLDSYTLTEQGLNKWRKSLDKLADGYDFNYELRTIIEQDLIEQRIPPPVNGEDFMNAGVEKGVILKKALELSRTIFYQNPCEKKILIKTVLDVLNS